VSQLDERLEFQWQGQETILEVAEILFLFSRHG